MQDRRGLVFRGAGFLRSDLGLSVLLLRFALGLRVLWLRVMYLRGLSSWQGFYSWLKSMKPEPSTADTLCKQAKKALSLIE